MEYISEYYIQFSFEVSGLTHNEEMLLLDGKLKEGGKGRGAKAAGGRLGSTGGPDSKGSAAKPANKESADAGTGGSNALVEEMLCKGSIYFGSLASGPAPTQKADS